MVLTNFSHNKNRVVTSNKSSRNEFKFIGCHFIFVLVGGEKIHYVMLASCLSHCRQNFATLVAWVEVCASLCAIISGAIRLSLHSTADSQHCFGQSTKPTTHTQHSRLLSSTYIYLVLPKLT